MKLNIDISNNDAHNCVDNIVAAIAYKYGRHYELRFSESWGFEYKGRTEDGRFSQQFSSMLNPSSSTEFLQKYHGIKLVYKDCNDSKEILEIAKRELGKGYPLILGMDIYSIPWYKSGYQIYHTLHYFIMTGYDEENSIIYCVDGQMAINGETLTFEDLQKGLEGYMLLELEERERRDIDWRGIVENAGDRLFRADCFNSMRRFGEDIGRFLDVRAEAQGYESYFIQAPFYQEFHKIGRGRKQFAKALKYIAEEYGQPKLAQVSELIKSTGDNWSAIFGMLIKLYYMPDSSSLIRKISSKIIEEAAIEENLTKAMLDICKAQNTELSLELENKIDLFSSSDIKEYYFVDLATYCNNQGFGTSLSIDCKAEMSNGGKYFLSEGLPDNNICSAGLMKFKFPDIGDNINDNISCDEQTIKLYQEGYTSIMILGCAEYGNHSEYMEVQYEDGYIEKVLIGLSNWGASMPNYGELIAWSGKVAVRNPLGVSTYPFPMHIYAKSYRISHKGTISEIKLPQCLNMHIFAITLGR